MKILNNRNLPHTFLFGFFTPPLLTEQQIFLPRYMSSVTPDYVYKRISAIVTLDRSPIGKHKKKASSKGVIVLYIPHSVLFEFGVKGDYIDTLYNSQLNEALSSHINSGIIYRMSIMAYRGAKNVTILRFIAITKEDMTQKYLTTIETIREQIWDYLNGEKNKYRDRLYSSSGIIRIIFTPDSNIRKDKKELLTRPIKGNFNRLMKNYKDFRSVSKANYSTSTYNSESNQNKMFDFSEFKNPKRNKYYWYSLICSNNPIITPNVLKEQLNMFYNSFKLNFKDKHFAFMWKIQFPNGDVRSCCTVQVADIDDFWTLYNTLCFIFTSENLWVDFSQEKIMDDLFTNNYPMGNIIFEFKRLKNIKGTKYEKFLVGDNKHFGGDVERADHKRLVENSFKYKQYSIPRTMDLTLWPNIRFFNEYKNAHTTFPLKIENDSYYNLDFNININDDRYFVIVSNKGVILFTFIDESTSRCQDLTLFKRTIVGDGDGVDKKPDKVYYFDNGEIIYYSTLKNVSFIDVRNKDILSEKPRIMTLDLESRLRSDKKMIPVCMSIYNGYYNLSFTFTKSWKLDMAKGLRYIMKRRYDGYKIYIHNFSYFDAIFMIDVLSTLGEVKPLMRDNNMLKLTFKYYTGEDKKRACTLHFYDSMLILPNSLDSLSKSFKVDTRKAHFPLKFLNNSNFSINYVGPVPGYDYFYKAHTKDFTIEDYNKYCNSYPKKWNLKKELIKYCNIDTIALYQVVLKFRLETYKSFEVDITKCPTTSSLAFAIYRSFSMPKDKIPKILGTLHHTLKRSFYGGITETYTSRGWDINSYDVNSLYPFTMRNFPMPTGKPQHFVGDPYRFSKDPFGFFKVKITAPLSLNKPFIPTRIKTKDDGMRTIYPVGTWEGWYFSEELKNGLKYGYRFDVVEGYLFEKGYIFNEYIDELYDMKSQLDSSHPMYYVSKLLMNGLFGRFGLNPENRVVLIVTPEESEKIIAEQKNVEITPLESGKVIISYMVDEEEGLGNTNISVIISSAIAAYSRIHMSHYLTKYDSFIHYIDTDGIKVNCKLSSDEVDNKELGKMKYEFNLTEALFPAPKFYGGKLSTDYKGYSKEMVKVKGLKNPIPYCIVKFVINKETKLILNQEKWTRNIAESTILVKETPYTLSLTENKRNFVFDSLGNYITSTPFRLNNGVLLESENVILYYLPIYKQLPALPILDQLLCFPILDQLLCLPILDQLPCLPKWEELPCLPKWQQLPCLPKWEELTCLPKWEELICLPKSVTILDVEENNIIYLLPPIIYLTFPTI